MTLTDHIFSNPWYVVLAFLLCAGTVGVIGKCINRFIRHLNIWSKGWPPAHLDADGDFKPADDSPEDL